MIELKHLLANYFQFFDTSIGVVTFVCFYAVWVTFLLPGLWPSMFAGFLYGPLDGTFVVLIGAFLGAEISFFLGRKIFRSWTQKRIANFPKLEAIQKSVSQEGLKLIFFTRLSPAFPFSLLNFVYGVSEVSFRDFTLGLIGILPGTIVFCGLGSLASDIAEFREILTNREDFGSLLLSIVGLISTLVVVFIVSQSVRNTLQEFDSSV